MAVVVVNRFIINKFVFLCLMSTCIDSLYVTVVRQSLCVTILILLVLARIDIMLHHLVPACSLDHTWDLTSKAFGSM